MLAQGSILKPWSPHPSEIYEGITRIDKDGIVVSQSNINGYTKMNASGFTVNNGKVDALTINSNGLTMAGSLFADDILHTKGGIYTYESIRGQGDNFAVVGSNGYTVVRSDKGDVYLQPAEGKEVKVTSATNASNYQLMRVGKLTSQGDVYAYGKMYTEGGTIVTSDRDRKKNIKPYKASALKEICDTTIYNYHLDTDLDEELQRVGVIMQEAPMDIVDISGKGVDLYQMISISWKAIQELKEENNNLKLELEEFKKVVK